MSNIIIHAQETEILEEPGEVNLIPSIIDIIEAEGAIQEFDIPEDILNNLDRRPPEAKKGESTTLKEGTNELTNKGNPNSNKEGRSTVTPRKPGVYKMQGYRIQVFSDGRNPATLQSRAKARGNMIVTKFPKYRGQIYTYSSSPNWYTRVGNFATQDEANAALRELKRAFPSFAAEMRVVKSQVTIVK